MSASGSGDFLTTRYPVTTPEIASGELRICKLEEADAEAFKRHVLDEQSRDVLRPVFVPDEESRHALGARMGELGWPILIATQGGPANAIEEKPVQTQAAAAPKKEVPPEKRWEEAMIIAGSFSFDFPPEASAELKRAGAMANCILQQLPDGVHLALSRKEVQVTEHAVVGWTWKCSPSLAKVYRRNIPEEFGLTAADALLRQLQNEQDNTIVSAGTQIQFTRTEDAVIFKSPSAAEFEDWCRAQNGGALLASAEKILASGCFREHPTRALESLVADLQSVLTQDGFADFVPSKPKGISTYGATLRVKDVGRAFPKVSVKHLFQPEAGGQGDVDCAKEAAMGLPPVAGHPALGVSCDLDPLQLDILHKPFAEEAFNFVQEEPEFITQTQRSSSHPKRTGLRPFESQHGSLSLSSLDTSTPIFERYWTFRRKGSPLLLGRHVNSFFRRLPLHRRLST